ncbi:MAG: DUF1302 family protein [Burkholderiales bacterium]
MSDGDPLPKLEDAAGLPSIGADDNAGPGSLKAPPSSSRLRGFVQQDIAYTYADPAHFSTANLRVQVGSSGQWSPNLKWKATLRGEVDPVYAWLDYYPDTVRNDQRFYGLIGETYVDTAVRGWDLRLGRQNIVWGEMVGLFFADVVTAKDLRSFVLPSFDLIRIPQWAIRGEHFMGDSHLELLWIPYTSFDRISKPGAEFYPLQGHGPAGFTQVFRDDTAPARSISNSNVGARYSTLMNGWDWSAFYYRSMDSAATFARDIVPTGPSSGTIIYTPRHDRIWQAGGTVSKDFGDAGIFKSEVVYTSGRSFNVSRLSQSQGLVEKDTIDAAVGIDYTLPADTRLNVQLFERMYMSHDSDMFQERFETGASVLINRKFQQKLEGEFLWIQSLNRWENLIRPRLIWRPEQNLRVYFGIDIFNGPDTGVFGRFRDRDRLYAELRYDF